MTVTFKALASGIVAASFSALLLASAPASAAQEEIKVGVVSLDRVLSESALAKASFEKLQQEFSRRKADVDKLQANFKARSEQYRKDGPAMSQDRRMAEQRELAEAERSLNREQRALREELGQRQNEEVQFIIARANRVIQELAKREKYDLILQDGVYFSPRIDITDKVLKELK